MTVKQYRKPLTSIDSLIKPLASILFKIIEPFISIREKKNWVHT